MIPVKNIYYMLSYAFQILKEGGYADIATEKFENAAELFAAILAKGITIQIKRGLNKEYEDVCDTISAVRGKVDVTESVKERSVIKAQLVCYYDELSENSYFNRILKTTAELLLKMDIPRQRKRELRSLMTYFTNVEILDFHEINWRIRYNRNNSSYHLLLSVCNLVIKGLIHTQSDGSQRLMTFLDEKNESKLYERFILEYYRKHYPELSANSEQIAWQLEGEGDGMLPIMQTDVMLKKESAVLIIDAKYYTHNTQTRYGSHTIHSANLYQIFAYVKNKEYELRDKMKVSGMLLYAKTEDFIQPNGSYIMSGNRIDVRTLDLNCDFSLISRQLAYIVTEFFE